MRNLVIVFGLLMLAQAGFGATIHIPSEHPTIQAGISAASIGDTLQVATGTYPENIVIYKSITLIGAAMNATIIDGSNNGDVIQIVANNVTIKKFSIINSGDSNEWYMPWDAGIKMVSVENCLIESCRIFDNPGAGIEIRSSAFNTIRFCTFNNNTRSIYFFGLMDETIPNSDNSIIHNRFTSNSAICFEHSELTHHESTIVRGNHFSSIFMMLSNNTDVSYNNFDHSGFAVWFVVCGGGAENNNYHHNFFNNNNSNSEQVYYENGYEEVYVNYWYDPVALEGNWWSDYTGVDGDGDGIGDEPYDIYGYNESFDNYPLMVLQDADGDHIIDSVDNCIYTFNPDQADANGNGIGDLCDAFICGDANGDGSVNLGDAGYIINYIFYDGPDPDPIEAGDANYDESTNLADAGYLINYIFYYSSPPVCP